MKSVILSAIRGPNREPIIGWERILKTLRSPQPNTTQHAPPIVLLTVTTMASVYQTCALEHGDDMPLLVQCVSNWVETTTKNHALNTDSGFVYSDFANAADVTDWLLILTGALVFFMQAGFAMVCAGAIRKKNVKNTVSFSGYG